MRLNKTSFIIIISAAIVSVLLFSVTIIFFPGYYSFLNSQHTEVCSDYDKEKRIIMVKCNSTLSEVGIALSDDNILKNTDGIWLLNSSLVVMKNATLTINPSEAKWLKISSIGTSFGVRKLLAADQGSNEPTSYAIQVFGRLDIHGVKVTSWDPETNNYTSQRRDGTIPRPFIAVEGGSNSSHISDSEIAYLGYNSSRKQGLSFYGGDDSTLTGNRIHNLWYGFISVNVGRISIENNTVYNNYRYGIDPHMGSHDMVISGNHIYNSRIGLICSLECSNMIFEKNSIENNNEIGLMFSRNSINSIAKYNKISVSDTGISISDSHLNKVYGNHLLNNSAALAIKDNSSSNISFNNTVSGARDCGILVVEAHNNTLKENNIENYRGSGICLTGGAIQNLFYSNEIEGPGSYGIDVRDGARENSFFTNVIHLADNAIRVYNNTETLFVDNKVGNTKGHQYIISGNSILNLVKTQFTGDRIRAAGVQPNAINIWNSGIINIVTNLSGNNTEIMTYDTDKHPYITKIFYNTIKIYSKTK